jgi:hypothetical protein
VNVASQRQKKLRKSIDDTIAEKASKDQMSKDKEVRLEAEQFVVARKNRAADKFEYLESKVVELLKSKGIDPTKTVYVVPPPPAAIFSQEKFKALVTLGLIGEDEAKSCLEPVAPQYAVEVDLPESVDHKIVELVLGKRSEIAATKKLPRKKEMGL